MITPEVITYIKEERTKNTPDNVIKSNLLSNGWSEEDVNQAMSTASSNVPKPMTESEIFEFKQQIKKRQWKIFFALIGIDSLIIIGLKIFTNSWGLFGIDPLSIILRILVIYIIASFSVKNASSKNSKGNVILRALGSIILTMIIISGVIFIGCFFVIAIGSAR